MAQILIVDDIAVNREVLATLLGYKSHVVSEAADGSEALATVRALKPDLVICDILMPTMDGYEFVRRLRTEPEIAETPVIYFTAHYHEREALRLAQSCGVLRVLTKPCDPSEILAAVDEALAIAPDPATLSLVPDFEGEHLRLMTDKLSGAVDDLRIANQRLAALTELNLQLASERDTVELLEKVCKGARELLGAKYAVVCVADSSGADTIFSTSGIEGGPG